MIQIIPVIFAIISIVLLCGQILILAMINHEFKEIFELSKDKEKRERENIKRKKQCEEEFRKASLEISKEAEKFIDHYLTDNHQ